MLFANLLLRAVMLSAPVDMLGLAALRAQLFGRLRESGWRPAAATRGRPGTITDSDEALLAALVRGEAEAFDALFDRHAGRLNGYARRCLQSADAADVVQDAFVVLFEKAEAVLVHGTVNVDAYLFATLRHKIQRVLAAHSREAVSDEAIENEPAADDGGLKMLLRREQAEQLAGLLDKVLNPLEQEVVMMALEERDGPEIATALGISPGYVRVLRHRAFSKLRRALEAIEEA